MELPSCRSTNQVASDLLSVKKPNEGLVVLTRNQTEGRGQRGSHWESEPGKNLTFSTILKPTFLPISRIFDLTIVASLAIVRSLADFGLESCKIKWPNDIYCRDAKIAGILIENAVRANQIEWAIVGIGLNVNQTKFLTADATSTKLENGGIRFLWMIYYRNCSVG